MPSQIPLSSKEPSESESKESQNSSPLKKKKGVKRRLVVQEDSSDEEGGTGPFRLLSDDEASKMSNDKVSKTNRIHMWRVNTKSMLIS